MRVAVTGGSGGAGGAVLDELASHGIDCLNIDIVPPKHNLCSFMQVDLTNYQDLYDAMEGVDALVHFAGNPFPDEDHFTGAERFENNTVSLFNAFNAAQARGIKRIVWASSETVYGFPFETNAPKEVPIIEASLRQPQNGYALSKAISEDLAILMASLHDMTFIGLRLSNVLFDDETAVPSFQKIPGYWPDTSSRRFNLWGYVDSRDAASAVRLALSADITGAEIFNIAAGDTIMRQPTRDLISEHFPEAQLNGSLGKFDAVMNCEKAASILGWKPEHSWSSVLGLTR